MIRPAILAIPRPRLAVLRIPALALVPALTLIYALFAAVVPPADDEYYYWCWAQSLQWSYYDHPAMTALFIRVAQELFGHSLVALRIPACLAMAFVFVAILHLTKPRAVAWWLLATPLFSLGAVIITPDTPLLLFWAAYVLWLVKMHQAIHESKTISLYYWCLGGAAFLGCGLLGKYTMALAGPAALVSFLLAAPIRTWLRGFLLHGLVAFAVTTPILIYNFQRDFAPLLYQWNHSMGASTKSLAKFGEFLGIQVLLFGTLPVALFPWVLWNWRRFAADPRLRVALCLYGFPFAFFLFKATRGHLEGNWALASYIAFWPLAAVWFESRTSPRLRALGFDPSFLAPILALLFSTIHCIAPFPFVKPETDRLIRQMEKDRLAMEMAKNWKANPLPLYAETYQWVSLLRFHGIDARQIAGASRTSHFTQIREHPGDQDECYILWENSLPLNLRAGFREPVLAAEFPLVVRGRPATTFYLWKLQK